MNQPSNRAARRAAARGKPINVKVRSAVEARSLVGKPAAGISGVAVAPGSPLHRLREAIEACLAADEELRSAVDLCRDERYSWTVIGREFGVSAQAVHKRFGRRSLASEA